ncbi:BtrH N-terminal domain-containing protein [Nocardioides marinisabuli]|uniref:BtrH N-terminal domain-containing protein n=1 Tax=Nocardioides marinisabuli TaxID=419476 RepID=UPI001C538BB7|nr:BtrH N-terminal domain-containing protein [Nocardioides marinisabuli]
MTTSHAAAQVSPYPHRIGGHCGSGALRDLLEWAGLGWDGPPSEGLVFALGGALGLSYVRSVGLFPPLYLVGRGGELELDLPRAVPRGVVGFEVILGAYMSLLSMAATGSVSLVL